jgi:ABC-type nitrate/sulfonate/bicarbonate transport system substrate-binding protein
MTDSLTALRLISFPGTGNLPLFAGTEKGFFKAQGVEIDLETTPSSMYQAQKLVAGEFNLACTAVDNVFAYQEGAGEIELDREPDLFIAMGATQIELCFVVAPYIETFADLKGTTIAMDALATGFAFVLYQMLENAGLSRDDVTLVSVGSTPSRWESVRDGKHAGTLLIEPFTSAARAAGFRVLESSLDTFTHYQGQVYTASRAWAAANHETLTAFMRGYLDALDWVLDPANRDEAEAMLAHNMPMMKPQAISPAMNKLMAPRTGLTPDAAIDPENLQAVLDLRARFGPNPPGGPDKYLDLSYYNTVMSARTV